VPEAPPKPAALPGVKELCRCGSTRTCLHISRRADPAGRIASTRRCGRPRAIDSASIDALAFALASPLASSVRPGVAAGAGGIGAVQLHDPARRRCGQHPDDQRAGALTTDRRGQPMSALPRQQTRRRHRATSESAKDRDRGSLSAPPSHTTCVRVRTRRFDRVKPAESRFRWLISP